MEAKELSAIQENAIALEIERAFAKGRIHGRFQIGFENIMEITEGDTDYSWGNNHSSFVIKASYGKINNEIIERYVKSREDFLSNCMGDLFTQKYLEQQVEKAYLEGQYYGVKTTYEGLDEEYCEVTKEDYRRKFMLFLTGALKHPKIYPEENEKFKM